MGGAGQHHFKARGLPGGEQRRQLLQFGKGLVGFGSFDETGAFRKVRISGK